MLTVSRVDTYVAAVEAPVEGATVRQVLSDVVDDHGNRREIHDGGPAPLRDTNVDRKSMTEPAVASPLASSSAKAFTLSGGTVMAVVFAVALGSSRSLTAPAALLVAGAGVGVGSGWYVARPRLTPRPCEVSPTAVGVWLAISGAFCVWEAAAFLMGDDDAHPTFSKLADPLLTHPGIRALAGLGWVVWGRHLASLEAWDASPESRR